MVSHKAGVIASLSKRGCQDSLKDLLKGKRGTKRILMEALGDFRAVCRIAVNAESEVQILQVRNDKGGETRTSTRASKEINLQQKKDTKSKET